MNNIINISKFIKDKSIKKHKRILDAKASYILIGKCLKMIEMNDMPELVNIKSMMRRTMCKLKKISKDD